MAARLVCALVLLPFAAAAADSPKIPRPTAGQRIEYIRRARIWEPTDVASKDLYNGPKGALDFAVDELIPCEFVPKTLPGWSEKFLCRLEDGRVFKVKYNENARFKEVYGEVLGTRLFWALGFYADRVLPVRVACHGCPKRPWTYVNARKHKLGEELPPEAEVATYTFDPATIEEPLDAARIEEHQDQGWSWSALDDVDARAGGATRAEIDAFKLLNAFVQNADNSHEQNALVCPRSELPAAGSENAACPRPILYVDDLGAVFGRGARTTRYAGRVDYEGWKKRHVWADARTCKARLAPIGWMIHPTNLKDPVIGEEGRALLADLLSRLSDAQIADLFRAARIERLHQTKRDGRDVTIDDWVALFKQKRDEITRHPGCESPR